MSQIFERNIRDFVPFETVSGLNRTNLFRGALNGAQALLQKEVTEDFRLNTAD